MTPHDGDPEFAIKALLEFGDRTREGELVRAVAIPWYEILATLAKDRNAAYQIDPRKWEEIIAGAWERDGYSVILTPRSADKGRDVIATKDGVGSVRIFDQVKAYRPGRTVNADISDFDLYLFTKCPELSIIQEIATDAKHFKDRGSDVQSTELAHGFASGLSLVFTQSHLIVKTETLYFAEHLLNKAVV